MKYHKYHKVTKLLIDSSNIPEEYLIRDIASALIKELPLEALKKLLNIEKLDPYEKDTYEKVFNSMDVNRIDELESLRREQVILFKLQVNI